MTNIILIGIYISLFLLVIFVEKRNPSEALLWILVLICFPYFGIILYLIFGSTFSIKLTAYHRNKKLASKKGHQENPLTNISLDNLNETDKNVASFNAKYNNSTLTCYEDIKFLTSGKEHYQALFKDIKEAKECIYIEFYTIHNDVVGNKLVEALTEKQREGIKVIVMCDFLANIGSPNKMFKPLTNVGGKLIRIKPYLTHFRSHRKIVTIDHKISYIGGMNIGKQYANMDKKKNPWRDTQVRIVGASTLVLDEYFENDYLCATSVKSYFKTFPKDRKVPKFKKTNNYAEFIIGGVDTSKEKIKMTYLNMIRNAKKSIKIQSPYFIPDESILDALKVALSSNVKVELMIPGIKASFFLDPVTNYFTNEIMKYGATVLKYDGYVHAKTMVIDDELCSIGSVNMDMRSLLVDDEICGIFYKNDLVKEYIKILENDKKHCKKYTLEDYKKRSFKEKILESIFLPFSPLM